MARHLPFLPNTEVYVAKKRNNQTVATCLRQVYDNNDLKTKLTNNSITDIYLDGNPNSDKSNNTKKINYTQLFELLKMNKSVKIIKFGNSVSNNHDYTKWYIMLCDTLNVNTNIKKFALSKTVLDINDCEYIDKILSVNKSITNLQLQCDLTPVVSDCVVNIIKNNNVIIEIYLYTCKLNEIANQSIKNALKYNYNIIDLYVSTISNNYNNNSHNNIKIKKYCDRNQHNIRLKSLMLCDL
jgi:hypothetical protein